jgi:cephalosporin-C deacetylase
MPFPDLAPDVVADYRSKAVAPPDFDAFWSATLAETRAHPLAVRFEPLDAGLPLFDTFDLTFNGYGGHPVRGWFIAPKGGARTCVVKYIGYGGGRSFAHEHLFWPATGRAVLVMDTRGQGSGWAHGVTPDPVGSDPAEAGFMTKGIQRREDYFYRRVYADAVRAVEAARACPGIDPARIAVTGGSQGGGISVAVAGLVPGLAAVMPDVPFLCDFARSVVVATRDPYLEIARYLAVHRWAEAQVMETLNHFDGVHFAARAAVPALFSVGLMDTICPPSTVYAAFNAYGGTKAMERYTFNDHEGGGPFQMERQREWLAMVLPA